jgi:hypothetical protein
MLESAPDEICASPYGLSSHPVRTPSTVNALPGSRPLRVLNRRLSDVVYRALRTDATLELPPAA